MSCWKQTDMIDYRLMEEDNMAYIEYMLSCICQIQFWPVIYLVFHPRINHLIGFLLFCRYIVKDVLGHGTFGQVAKCWFAETNSFVAVKIIKNQPAYYQQALVEVTILTTVNIFSISFMFPMCSDISSENSVLISKEKY